MKHKRYRSGFTIVEVLIVCVVLAIVASITIFAYTGQQKLSRDDKRINDIKALAHELDNYYDKNGNYPLSCGHTVPASSTCATMSSNYSTAYGSPIPSQIGDNNMTRDQIKAILPGIGNSFGDPFESTAYPINQHVTISANQIRKTSYAFISPDALNTSFTVYLATNTSGSSSISCNVTPTTNDFFGTNKGNRPHNYIIGYFNESQDKWVFYSGPKLDTVNNLGWNSGGNTACALSTFS